MNLYHWYASCLKNYSDGDIIVMAPSLEEAKEKVRAYAGTYLKYRYEWWFKTDGTLDPDCTEDYEEFLTKLERDLAADPVSLKHQTIFIRGSD